MRPAALLAALLASAPLLAGERGSNRWLALPVKTAIRGYEYAEPVYVPSRGQLLHWGAIRPIYKVPTVPRNDVRAFQSETGQWVCDYPPTDDLKGVRTLHHHGTGTSYVGTSAMLECGTPTPSMIVNAACYVSKRDQVVYTMKGLTAAYDPRSKTWRDMGARTILYGQEYPGGPPVYGAGTCYDPVNDQVVLFPHFSGRRDPKNVDLRDVTGRVSGHLGTLVYDFEEKTWRRASHTFGSEEVKAARKALLGLMGRTSRALDRAWRLRRLPDPEAEETVRAALAAVAADAGNFPNARPLLLAASRATTMAEALDRGSRALRALEAVLGGRLRVEPPPRCAAPMVYLPGRKAIVMFGGHSGLVRSDLRPSVHLGSRPGALNDTWLYECTTRQWRQVGCSHRPPPQRRPRLFHDPASGLVMLVTFEPAEDSEQPPATSTLWSLDLEEGEWRQRGKHDFPAPLTIQRCYASHTGLYNVGYDPRRRLLVMFQNIRNGTDVTQHTYVMELEPERLPSELAPRWEPPPPLVPHEPPPDDPAWVASLEALPPNRWVRAEPPRDATSRDWGNLACDPVRGWVVYFGGGHSTYQVNDVAIYAVGANRWAHAAGDHNDFVPPVGWGGVAMGFRGGRHAHHQRNQYVALDGRMYVRAGGWPKMRRHGYMERGQRPGPRTAWFYDVDRGGVWRQQKIAEVAKGEGVDGTWGAVHVVDPAGRILGFVGNREQYYGKTFPELFVSIYDVYRNRLEIRKVPEPYPQRWGECRPFCALPDRDQVFFHEYNRHTERHVTWVYDVGENRFVDLQPTRQCPPGEPLAVVYVPGQKAVLAIINRRPEKEREQWVYSFEHNAWAPLPIQAEGRLGFAGPYGQMVYVPTYGVLVNTGSANRGTSLMRPDFSAIEWE
ncbi:MAG: hypothetical protein ACLF0G_13260 [Candidatus Brocadiia bacterium]